MTNIVETPIKFIMDSVLDQLINTTRCLCCGNVLDGHWWNPDANELAKPSYISLEFCSFVCDREYESIWGYQRDAYDHTTKF